MQVQATRLFEQIQRYGDECIRLWESMDSDRIRGYEGQGNIDFLEDIEDPKTRRRVAMGMNNTLYELDKMDEATRMHDVGSYEKWLFPIAQAVLVNRVIDSVVAQQPLPTPSGQIFYLDAVYGSTKGRIAAGEKAYDVKTGHNAKRHYTGEVIDREQIGVGDGVTVAYAGVMAWPPMRAGHLHITTTDINGNILVVYDDGNGNLIGNVAGVGNAVIYPTGVYTFTFSAAPALAAPIYATYRQNMEGTFTIPELDLRLTSEPIFTEEQKLKILWSLEAAQDYKAVHGRDAEADIVSYASNLIIREDAVEIIQQIRAIAAAGVVNFDRTPPPDISWRDHRETFMDVLLQAEHRILAAAGRGGVTFIWASLEACEVIGGLEKFARTPAPTGVTGPHIFGTLDGTVTVIRDPDYQACEFLIGWNGSGLADTGFVYAVYVPLMSTNTLSLEDMNFRKGFIQRVARKGVNGNFYVTGTITESSPCIPPVCTTRPSWSQKTACTVDTV